jgi:hypothetical protein
MNNKTIKKRYTSFECTETIQKLFSKMKEKLTINTFIAVIKRKPEAISFETFSTLVSSSNSYGKFVRQLVIF